MVAASSAWLRFVALVAERRAVDNALEEVFERAWTAAREVLGDADEEAFLAYLVERLPGDTELRPALEGLHIADLALAFLLSEWRRPAIELFERDYAPALVAAVRRVAPALDPTEIVQEARVQVLVGTSEHPPKIREYRGDGRLRAWLRVVVVRASLNRVSRSRELPVEDAFFEAMIGPGNTRSHHGIAIPREVELVKEALRAAIPLLSNREKSLIQLSYIDGASLEELGGMYGVHRQTIARWLDLARDRVKRAIETELRDQLEMSSSEAEILVQKTMGNLDSPVARLLTQR
jgi:RNA polymerase sigma-70 factor, ECF subfamily